MNNLNAMQTVPLLQDLNELLEMDIEVGKLPDERTTKIAAEWNLDLPPNILANVCEGVLVLRAPRADK